MVVLSAFCEKKNKSKQNKTEQIQQQKNSYSTC